MNTLKEKPHPFISRLKNLLWNKMGFQCLFDALVTLIRLSILFFTYPVLWLDGICKNIRDLLKPLSEALKAPTKRQVYAKMTSTVIDGICNNKNTIMGSRSITRIKVWCVVLLELVSFVTTAIGMTIIASDISPAIAIIWALVIQSLVSVLAATRGKLNNVILVICLVFSIVSDYVCYINAVFPYETYIEQQYTSYKNSYDLVWEHALGNLQEYSSADAKINDIFNAVENDLELLGDKFSPDTSETLNNELNALKGTLTKTDPVIKTAIGTNVTIDPVTGDRIYTSVYQTDPNPAYTQLQNEVQQLQEKADLFTTAAKAVAAVQEAFHSLNEQYEGNVQNYVVQLLQDINHPDRIDILSKQVVLENINGKLLSIQMQIEDIAQRNGIPIRSQANDLLELNQKSIKYTEIYALQLPPFSQIEHSTSVESSSAYDWLFEKAAWLLDSEFAGNATRLKTLAEQKTTHSYAALTQAIAAQMDDDPALYALVHGSADSSSQGEGIQPLAQYSTMIYLDPISKALEYVAHPGDNLFAVITRVIYAFLADGIVLLIGISMRKKNTAVYRIHNRKDLINEEPRLISEAFYNLASKYCRDLTNGGKMEATLIDKLEDFRAQFEPECFFRDPNLNSSYSLVCKNEAAQLTLHTDYCELFCLLQTLKYIKPISQKQYQFVAKYKLNKATVQKDALDNDLKALASSDENYYYLMTEGFALYLSEKINDLRQSAEANQHRDEIKETLRKA